MKLWRDLVNSALFGAERRRWQPPAGPSCVELILASAGADDPAETVLRAAATVGLYHRAGTPPVKSTGARCATCPPESLPRCGPATAERLRAMLNDTHADLIPTALECLASARQRLPEDLLPAFIEIGTRRPDIRDALRAAGGERGTWLASQNTDWAWLIERDMLVAGDVATAWETGSIEERRALLKQLRARDPARATELLASTWDQDKAEQRSELLAILRTGLAMRDEEFLEARLGDKSLAVRRAAADLLASLPESRLSQRMLARVQPLLRLEAKGLLRKTGALEVTLPEAADKTLDRDGIRPQAHSGHGGERASLLFQMLAMIPPSNWTRAFGRAPGELMQAAGRGDWKELLWSAWALAAERHRDVEWAATLAEGLPLVALRDELLAVIPETERDALLVGVAEKTKDLADVLRVCRFQFSWSAPLTRAVLRRVRKANEQQLPVLRAATLAALPFVHPDGADEIGEEPETAALADALRFKRQLVRDIQNRC